MRQLTCIFLTLVILTSCSNDKASTAEDANQMDSLKKTFLPFANGVWVLTDYIKAIEQTKSPLKAADNLQGVVTMVINEETASDSIKVSASWNNHEAYYFTAYFAAGKNPNSLKTNVEDFDEASNYYELGYETINNETSLILYHYDKTNKLIDKKGFTKITDKQQSDDVAWGLQYVVNEKLFSGDYLLTDEANASTKISLKNDGSLTDHPNFKTYYLFTDFLGGPMPVIDMMAFNINEENFKSFAFKIENNTIFLYSTIGDEEAGEVLQLDKVKYKLVRQ